MTDTGTLVRQELHLASTEMGEKAKSASSHVGTLVIGGGLAHAGVITLLAAIVLGLGMLIPLWAAAAITGVVVLLTGWLFIRKGLTALRALDPLPRRALESLRPQKTFAKDSH